MQITLKHWLALSGFLAFFSVPTVWADDGAITAVGGRIRIMGEHPGVVLVAEQVHARVSIIDGIADVECVFVLSNHAAAESVLIGFPESAGGDTGARPFLFFRSYVDGQEVLCTREEGEKLADPLFWWKKTVYFSSGQTHVVRNEYRSPLGSSVGDSTGNFRFFEYTLWTGSSWFGKIGTASIVLTLSPCDAIPEPHFYGVLPVERDDCEYRWHLSEVEPGRGSAGLIQVGWLVPFPQAVGQAK